MTKLSLRAAINAHCRACLYDPGRGNGHWREQIDACSSTNCALWPVRPRASKTREKAVSSPENASEPPTLPAEPQTEAPALLGAAFRTHGRMAGE